MTMAGKQARRRETIKQKIVHGIQENGMNYRKTISSMIVRPAKREAGMGDREAIGRLIVRFVRREEGRAGETHIYDMIYTGEAMPWGISRPDETHIEGERFRCAITMSMTRGFTMNSVIQSTRRR